jgi:uncharacterized protein (TIGR00730 family)
MTAKKRHHALPNVSESEVMPTEHSSVLMQHSTLIDEIKETADRLGRDQATRGDLKILSRALKELRYAFKVFTPFRRQRKITVFGSARTSPDHPSYIQTVDFGKRMAEEGWMILTGAGGGIMEAAHVGAGREMSMGVNIMLPFEQEANPVIAGDDKLVHLKYFFTRKLLFVKEVHGVVVCAGGFGTMDECFEIMTLVQTGKRDLMPIVLLDESGGTYWNSWLEFVKKELLGNKLIAEEDLSLIKVTDSVDVAIEEIMKFYSVYNSMRYVNEKLIVRLHTEPSDEFITQLNKDFSDILVSGKISKTVAHRYEADDDHLLNLPRLSFRFDRKSIGRLREMIDVINEQVPLD